MIMDFVGIVSSFFVVYFLVMVYILKYVVFLMFVFDEFFERVLCLNDSFVISVWMILVSWLVGGDFWYNRCERVSINLCYFNGLIVFKFFFLGVFLFFNIFLFSFFSMVFMIWLVMYWFNFNVMMFSVLLVVNFMGVLLFLR